MGILQPLWVTKKWFMGCPFNYCDHFGDIDELSLMCKVCKEGKEAREKCISEGKDPDSWDYAFSEVGKNLAIAMAMVQKKAVEMGIDLSKIEAIPEERFNAKRYKIHKIAQKYGDRIEKIIKSLEVIPGEINKNLIGMAIDALAHSRTYVIVKIGRALWSRNEEKKNKYKKDIWDSKTSAMFAYMAVERNSRVLGKLSKNKHFSFYFRETLRKNFRISLDFADLIRQEFFPKDKLDLKSEYGCEEFNNVF